MALRELLDHQLSIPLRARPYQGQVKLEWLAKQQGHADTTMIKKHYGKLIPADTKRMGSAALEKVGLGEDWSGV